MQVLKALSRSPIVIRQVLTIGKDLRRRVRSIKETVVFDEEEITEEILQNRVEDVTRRIDELQKHYKRVGQLAERLPTIASQKKAYQYSRCRWRLGRELVRISLIIRNLGLTNFERKRLIGRVNKTMEIMRSLDRQDRNLEKKIESTHSEELKKEYRKAQRQHRADLERQIAGLGALLYSFKSPYRVFFSRINDDRSMNNTQMKLFKTRLWLVVAFLAIVGLAAGLHQLMR